jgi:hypothetical protein
MKIQNNAGAVTLRGPVLGSLDASVTFDVGVDIELVDDEVHLSKDGKQVRLRPVFKRKPVEGDIDVLVVGYEIRRADFAEKDEVSPAELSGKTFGPELMMHHSHDSNDGEHERIVEEEHVNHDLLVAALAFLGMRPLGLRRRARTTMKVLAELSAYPEGLRGAIVRAEE